MFDYKREFIVNKPNNLVQLDGTTPITTVAQMQQGFMLKTPFLKCVANNIENVYYHKGHAAVAEKLVWDLATDTTVDVSNVSAGDVIRFHMILGQEGRTIAPFNGAYPDHTRDVFYEAISTGNTATTIVTDLKAVIDAGEAKEQINYFKATLTGTSITIECLDPYTRINEIYIERVVPNLNANVALGNTLTGYNSVIPVATFKRKEALKAAKAGVTFTAGEQGAGTASMLIRNRVLPTQQNLDIFGSGAANPENDDRPIPGMIYDQVTVEYRVRTRQHGGFQVGAISEASMLFIFYIPSKASLTDTFTTITEGGCVIPDTLEDLSGDINQTVNADKETFPEE